MLAAVSFGVCITAVTVKCLTTLLTGLRLLTVCHKILCTQGSMSLIPTQFAYAWYCVIQSLHEFCTQGTASFNPYTSFVHKVLRHSILTQVVCARYCVIQSLHKLYTQRYCVIQSLNEFCTQCIASFNPYRSCVR